MMSSPARALLEIAGEVTPQDLERALDEGLVRRLVRVSEVRAVLARNRRCRGSAALAALANEGDDEDDPVGGGETVPDIDRKGAPATPRSTWSRALQVDFLWREQRLIVETDGYNVHRGRRAFKQDRERDAELEAAGWRVIRLRRRQLLYEPEVILFRLGQMMGASPRVRAA